MSEGLSFDLALDHPGFSMRMMADLPGHGITALVGPSGAGKTTLLQAIAGLEPARGHVTLDGRALHPLPAHRRGVAVVFQNTRLFGHLDVAGNIGFGAARRGTPARDVDRIVSALDLQPLMSRAVSRLSGGESRRVSLARALAATPDLLLLDEPLSGLDPERRAEILPYLARAIRASGCPALFVTHDDRETLALADRRLAVADGRITGTMLAPPLLELRPDSDNPMRAMLGDLRLALPHPIAAGERWAMVLDPGQAILVRGPATAVDAVSLPVRVTRVTEDHALLRACGQEVTWPMPLGKTGRPEVGEDCQLLARRPLLRLLDMPNQSEGEVVFARQ